jgi:transposase
MPKPKKADPKVFALQRTGTLNPHPTTVTDPLFQAHPFFDPRDLLQTRYEMLRRQRIDGLTVVEVAATFGVSRPTFYQAQRAFASTGLSGLLPQPRGPKEGHKLSAAIVAYVRELQTAQPQVTMADCLQALHDRFGLTVHRRSLERALQRKKNYRCKSCSVQEEPSETDHRSSSLCK